jgi:hypothetical protein
VARKVLKVESSERRTDTELWVRMGLVTKLAVVLGMGMGSMNWSDHIAAHYAPGVFLRVEIARGLPHATCNFASPTLAIGAWRWIEGVRTGVRLRCRVSDTSQPQHRGRHLALHLIELDYESTRAICGSTRLANRDCPVRVSSS